MDAAMDKQSRMNQKQMEEQNMIMYNKAMKEAQQ